MYPLRSTLCRVRCQRFSFIIDIAKVYEFTFQKAYYFLKGQSYY